MRKIMNSDLVFLQEQKDKTITITNEDASSMLNDQTTRNPKYRQLKHFSKNNITTSFSPQIVASPKQVQFSLDNKKYPQPKNQEMVQQLPTLKKLGSNYRRHSPQQQIVDIKREQNNSSGNDYVLPNDYYNHVSFINVEKKINEFKRKLQGPLKEIPEAQTRSYDHRQRSRMRNISMTDNKVPGRKLSMIELNPSLDHYTERLAMVRRSSLPEYKNE